MYLLDIWHPVKRANCNMYCTCDSMYSLSERMLTCFLGLRRRRQVITEKLRAWGRNCEVCGGHNSADMSLGGVGKKKNHPVHLDNQDVWLDLRFYRNMFSWLRLNGIRWNSYHISWVTGIFTAKQMWQKLVCSTLKCRPGKVQRAIDKKNCF